MTDLSRVAATQARWDTFVELLRARRAVRDFADRPIAPGDLDAILDAAGQAPSSMGMQPYELHVVMTAARKALVAEACNGQRAARSAPVLVALVVGPGVSRSRIAEAERYYRDAPLPQRSRDYHLGGVRKLAKAHHRALLPFLGLAGALLAWLRPSRGFLPLGSRGLREWGARNAMLAAQNLMLAASARGLDSCPMEGFDGARVAKLLGLPASSAVAVVIALGHRSDDALIEPRWRRDIAAMVTAH